MNKQIPWLSKLVEGALIVGSILLAFGIQAWWEGHQLRQQERGLLAGLLADFESSRPGLASRLTLARRMAVGTADFLDLTNGGPVPGQFPVADSLVVAVLGGPTYEPATNTLDAALASGEIEVLESDELRAELANWRRLLSDTAEDEREVRRITNEQIVPLLSRAINLRPYFDAVLPWSGGDPYGAGRLIVTDAPGPIPGHALLTITPELVGAVSLRSFYVEFSAADLQELLASLDRSTTLLHGQLNR